MQSFVAFLLVVSFFAVSADFDSDEMAIDQQPDGTGARARRASPLDFLERYKEAVGECYTAEHRRICNRMCQETQKDGGNSGCFCQGRCGWYQWRRECRCAGDNCRCRE